MSRRGSGRGLIAMMGALGLLLGLGPLVGDSSAQAPGEGAKRPQARPAGPVVKPATKPTEPGKPRPSAAKANPRAEVTPDQEAAVLAFVQQHHPDLEELLRRLRDTRPREYANAVRSLFRISVRLATTRERDPDHYELELAIWKLESRVQLLAAKIAMHNTEELRGQLRDSIGELVAARRQLLVADRERLSDRVAKLDEQIEQLNGENAQREVERQLQLILRAGGVRTPGGIRDQGSGISSPTEPQ